ncbi:MAG: Ketoacyl reductase [Myxococcales bacterium]|nr:Ketoacyl reductase [Myxococcales bacterium]
MNMQALRRLGTAVGLSMVIGSLLRRLTAYDLRDKVVVVTGGSRGLGLVLARQLVARGAKVAICARDRDELERARAELAEGGGRVIALPSDITDRAQIDRLIDDVTRELGPIDVLINNAGVIQVGPMSLMTVRDYERAMATHFWGPLHLMLAAIPGMVERAQGRIVNITSIGGKLPVPHLLPYTASKFALVGLSEGMRTELAKDHVYVTTVVPGLMRTGSPMHASLKGNHYAEYAWFAIADSSHLTSMQAERAARQILGAMTRGKPEVVLSIQAKLATKLYALAPALVQRVLGLVDRLLPKLGSLAAKTGEGGSPSSILTRASDRAALRNNEL